MIIMDADYGGFIVSKNIISGKAIRYTFRDKSSIPELNGWTIYSIEDDDNYVQNVHIGFYDLVSDSEVTIEQIVKA